MQELQTKMARAASLMSQLAPPSSSASVQITPGQGPAIVIQSPEDPRVTQDPPGSGAAAACCDSSRFRRLASARRTHSCGTLPPPRT